MKSNKIALGTVQWGMNYGISNKKGIPSNNELDKIISLARINGINLLDTAKGYGDAEERIGKFSNLDFRIVTKINSISVDCSVENQVEDSLQRLKNDILYGCLFHDVNELLKLPSLWEDINFLKKKGKIEKIGVSLYNPYELEQLLSLNIIPDLIQIPFNIVDRRFEKYFKTLSNLKIEIHARSIFLQGLLLNFEMMDEIKFSKWDYLWDEYKNWLKIDGLSPLEATINHVASYEEISKIVVGVECELQLQQIMFSLKKGISKAPNSLISFDEKLINPSLW